MKSENLSSNQDNAMKDILKPLESIREVDPPYFLKDRILAKVAAFEQQVSPRTVALASAAVTLVFLVSVYTVTQNQTDTNLAAGLIQNNNLY